MNRKDSSPFSAYPDIKKQFLVFLQAPDRVNDRPELAMVVSICIKKVCGQCDFVRFGDSAV
jgi:hypothetical protein